MPEVSRGNWLVRGGLGGCATAALVGILGVITFAIGTPGFTLVVLGLLINVVLVVAMETFMGNSGLISFGHVGFMALGAYIAILFTIPPTIKELLYSSMPTWIRGIEWGLWPAVGLTVAVVAVIALISGFPLMRLQRSAVGIGTFSILVITYVILSTSPLGRNGQPLYGVPEAVGLWSLVGAAAIAIVVARIFRESPWGLRVRASREDETAAGSLGVSILMAKVVAWTLSGAMMAFGGVLWAHHLRAFSPRSFYFHETFILVAMLIVGGMGSVSGAVTGAVIVSLLTEVFRRVADGNLGFMQITPIPGFANVMLGVIMIAVLILRPSGLTGMWEVDDGIRWLYRRVVRRGRAPKKATAEPVSAVPQSTRREPETGSTLVVAEVSKSFAGVHALQSVSLSVAEGEIVGLIGPNGSGKTTLLNVISGLLKPDAGHVSIDERDLTGLSSPKRFRMGLGRTFQNIRLFGHLSVFQNAYVPALCSHRPKPTVQHTEVLARRFHLGHLMDAVSGALPYGAQRRVEIVRALSGRARFLLLDEPAAGMNDVETRDLRDLLQHIVLETGCGLLIIEHDLEFIFGICDRVVVLNEGRRIFEGPAEAARTAPEVCSAYLGEEVLPESPESACNPEVVVSGVAEAKESERVNQ